MPETAKNLFFVKGKFTAKAKGYWFTAGGEKGSFGYYPHLKNQAGYPVYPDTQLHGVLRMASIWLSRLEQSSYTKSFVKSVFGYGSEGHESSGKCKLTDLALEPDSIKDTPPFRFFQIKPRIEINDETGTAKDKMLVMLELCYLEGKTLSADLFLGYFHEERELEKAKKLLEESVSLLPGLSAFRSRGFGRGEFCIMWEKPVEFRGGGQRHGS